MADLVHQLITESVQRTPEGPALKYRDDLLTFKQLADVVNTFAAAMMGLGLGRSDRVAIYAEKRLETVIAMFGASAAGGVYVLVNPLLKAEQVAYILADCNVRVLVTSAQRLAVLAPALGHCPDLRCIVSMGDIPDDVKLPGIQIVSWNSVQNAATLVKPHRVIDNDMAPVLYTYRTPGRPQGLVLSHR